MKQTLIYASAAIAFAAAAFAFAEHTTWPGILVAFAGVIAIAAAVVKSDPR